MVVKGNKELGTFIRKHRQGAKLSLRALADQVGVDHSYIARIEQSQTDAPSADKLLRIARVVGVEAEDLYALAGYVMPEGLPEFRPYLRAKYPDLSQKDLRAMDRYFKELRDGDGGKQ